MGPEITRKTEENQGVKKVMIAEAKSRERLEESSQENTSERIWRSSRNSREVRKAVTAEMMETERLEVSSQENSSERL